MRGSAWVTRQTAPHGGDDCLAPSSARSRGAANASSRAARRWSEPALRCRRTASSLSTRPRGMSCSWASRSRQAATSIRTASSFGLRNRAPGAPRTPWVRTDRFQRRSEYRSPRASSRCVPALRDRRKRAAACLTQVRHVGDRIGQLCFAQRPARPVGEAARLVDVSGNPLHQLVAGKSTRHSRARWPRNLGIDNRVWNEPRRAAISCPAAPRGRPRPCSSAIRPMERDPCPPRAHR